jgi:hypothetical protein
MMITHHFVGVGLSEKIGRVLGVRRDRSKIVPYR